MPGVARLRDPVNKSRIVRASRDVFANEPGGAASPTTSVVVTPVPLSPQQIAAHAFNVSNPGQYDTSYNREKGIQFGAEVPTQVDGVPSAPIQTISTCTQGAGASQDTLVQLLQQSVQEATGTNAWTAQFTTTGASNPNIKQLYGEVGYPYFEDNTAWCAAFAGTMLKRACFKFKKTLSARDYLTYGTLVTDVTQARRGDVILFPRQGGSGRHVRFFWGFNGTNSLQILGGNQGRTHAVTLVSWRYFPGRVLGIRRPVR